MEGTITSSPFLSPCDMQYKCSPAVQLDTVIAYLTGIELTVLLRMLIHIPAIPLVAGVSYEFLKLSAKHKNNIVLKMLSRPGLWLQNITTKEPDDQQIEPESKWE